MKPMTESLLFIQALLAHTDRLRALLGEQWPGFGARLADLLAALEKADSDDQVLLLVDEIFELGLHSPANELVRSLFNQAATEAGSLDSTTRSVRMTDPTSGQSREVEVRSEAEGLAKGATVSRGEVIAAGQTLLRALQADEAFAVEEANGGGRDLEAAAPEAALPPTPDTEKHIGVWVSERADRPVEPLHVGETYTLNFRVGQAVEISLVRGPETVVPAADVPPAGLDTEWVVTSRTVELAAATPDTTVTTLAVDHDTVWTARFALHIPKEGDSAVSQLKITPRATADAGLEIVIYVRQELYRQFSVQLAVVNGPGSDTPTVEAAVIHHDLLHSPTAHTNLQTTHEWTTPPGETSMAVFGQNAYAKGEDRARFLDQPAPWYGTQAVVAGPIKNVRDTAERFRAKWETYLNDIDPADLSQRLAQWVPEYDWTALRDFSGATHQDAWQAVQVSTELRDLAYDGHRLYEAFFPDQSPLRGWLDSLTPGHRLNLSWLPTSGAGWIPHIPWGLMYLPDVPAPGEPVDPLGFWALRFRLGYTAHEVQAGSKALGPPQTSYGGHFLYWGDQPNDPTGIEAQWQRQQWQTWQNQVFIPASPAAPDSKQELLSTLDRPNPSPMAVLYLFCQCTVGDGNDPVLRFGSTRQMADVIRRTELGTKTLSDRPFVFANACTTAATDPYIANELEESFFNRGCRAYLGTETKVPIQFASRFASIFFHFFYRQMDPQPMAAGEAVSQTRLFLWTQYRNIGGIFYAYVNQYELFLADDDEVVALRY